VLIGVFEDRLAAENALFELEGAGFKPDQVGFAIRGADAVRGGMITDAEGTKDRVGAISGAVTGGMMGGALGAAAALLMPGVGPVILGGILASFVGGAIAGTAVGGILGAMTGLGISEQEALHYEKAFAAGKALVAVRPESRTVEAAQILRLNGVSELQNRFDDPVPTEGAFSDP